MAAPTAPVPQQIRPFHGLQRMNRAEIDRTKYGVLAAEAMEMAIDDLAIIPLYFQPAIWAMRAGLTREPRADSYTLVFEIKPSR